MSNSHDRKKRRKLYTDSIAYDAAREGCALSQKATITPRVHLLRRYYYIDGVQFNTGFRKRPGGGMRWTGNSDKWPIARPIQRRNGKQIDLRSQNVHKRIENPELYKKLHD